MEENEDGREVEKFKCLECPQGFFCDGVLQEPQGCSGNAFCGNDDEFMYKNGACAPIPPGEGAVRRRRTLVDEVELRIRDTIGEGARSASDCRCIRGNKETTQAGDFICDDEARQGGGAMDFILENGPLGLPLCVLKVVNASAGSNLDVRRRGGTTNIKVCTGCESGKFKVNVGNEECRDTCPMNMRTDPGAWKAEHCYCTKPEYRDNGDLASSGFFYLERKVVCEPCPTNKGAVYCPGDFTALSKVTLNEKDEVVISSAGAALDGSSGMPLCPSEGGTANCKRVVGKHKRPQADAGSFMVDSRIGLALECYAEIDAPEDSDDYPVMYAGLFIKYMNE